MQVAVRVCRRFDYSQLESVGYFVPGHDAATLLDGLSELGLEPLPRVHQLANGFLVRLDAPAP